MTFDQQELPGRVEPIGGRVRTRWAILLVVACLVTYANGLTGAFTYDDKAIVRDNPRIRSPRNLPQIFTTSYFGSPRGTGTGYRPILLLSFAAQWWIHARSAVAFHAVNVAFHAAATLLLAGLLLRLQMPPPAALASALLFAVHPIHVEAVTSLVGRGETQAAVFTLFYLHLALRLFSRRPDLGRWTLDVGRILTLAAALLCYGLALLSKESAAADPAFAFLLFLFAAEGTWRHRLGTGIRRGLPVLAGSACVLAAVFLLRGWVLGGYIKARDTGIFEVENALDPLTAGQRMANAVVILLRYAGRILLPLHLSADESAWSIRPLPALSVLSIAAVLLVGATAVLSVAGLFRRSFLGLGFLFFCVAMLPAGNLLFPIGTIFAERIAYLASAGICLAAGALLAAGAEGLTRRRRSALAAIVLALAARAVVRNAVWQSDEGLFFNLIQTSPESAKAHYDYAYASADLKHYRRALAHYERATEIYEDYWDAWAGKGRMEKELGLLEDAEDSYKTAIEIRSDYENGYFGLGLVREARGDWRGAEEAYRQGLAKKVDSLPLAYRLALARSRLGATAALANWRRALAIGPDSPAVRADFAAWLLGTGQNAQAAREAREALRRDPACLTGLRVLAQRDAREGWKLAEALAREKAYRVSREEEDWRELLALARESAAYGKRFTAVKGTLRAHRDSPSGMPAPETRPSAGQPRPAQGS